MARLDRPALRLRRVGGARRPAGARTCLWRGRATARLDAAWPRTPGADRRGLCAAARSACRDLPRVPAPAGLPPDSARAARAAHLPGAGATRVLLERCAPVGGLD